jgi:uncharacterized protein
MLSYEVDPLVLVPHVPRGTSLDFYNGCALLSVVGFRMLNTRVAGVRIPLQQDLEQVNLRFYVWRREGAAVRHGVVFLKEIVPSTLMAIGARLFFQENYSSAPMRHEVAHAEHGWASYEWQASDRWNRVSAKQLGPARAAAPQSIEAFVKDRPWGYTRQASGATSEYHVVHPSWDIWPATDPVLDCDVAAVFGRQFATSLSRPPLSAFIAVGSEATVQAGRLVD